MKQVINGTLIFAYTRLHTYCCKISWKFWPDIFTKN